MELKGLGRTRPRSGVMAWLAGTALVVLVTAGIGLVVLRDDLRSPQALYREAQIARPERAAVLYQHLAEKLPAITEYARLWSAQSTMPTMDALRTLQAVADFRPQSPAAFEAHLALARYYAGIDAPQAQDRYRAALAVHDPPALRLELARWLEEQGDLEGAYAEYHRLLGPLPDAFEGMRRTGQDPLSVARDLNAAYYFSDALEALRQADDPAAVPLRAEALAGLSRLEEAEAAYRSWLAQAPDDNAARLGLARILQQLDRPAEAMALYQAVDTADGRLAQAGLLEGQAPDQALALYRDSPYPEAWWSATALLEAQGRITETLPLYARLAASDTYLADDAAYRMRHLARQAGDPQAQADAEALLAAMAPNWLALRASAHSLDLGAAPPLVADGGEILDKALALEAIGREDLAHLELTLAAAARRAPELDLAMAQALAARGHLIDAQAIAEEYTRNDSRAPAPFWPLSYPQAYSDTVEAAATEFDLDPRLLWAVMREESRYDPEAVSYVGARGLMQIMPTTQAWIAEQWGEAIPPGEAFVPEVNVRMGAWFLRFLLDYFDGDLELAVAAYNGGAGSVDGWLADPRAAERDDLLRWIGYGETREYLSRVLLSYEIYRQLDSSAGTSSP